MTFTLHPRLEADTLPLGALGLCDVRLMDDARFPWLILVPRRADLVEVFDLTAAERAQLMEEVAAVSRALDEAMSAQKINIGALGNIVPQLHVHVVARQEGDAAWPGPVWGSGTAEPYAADGIDALRQRLSTALAFR